MDETEALRQVNHLIARLEKERQQAMSEVERLSSLLEAEKEKNQAEWKHFFDDACLKNTITGEPIRCLEDFYRWKAAFDKAIAEREKAKEAQQNIPKPDIPPKAPTHRGAHYLMETSDGELVGVWEKDLPAFIKKYGTKSEQPNNPSYPAEDRDRSSEPIQDHEVYSPSNTSSSSEHTPSRSKGLGKKSDKIIFIAVIIVMALVLYLISNAPSSQTTSPSSSNAPKAADQTEQRSSGALPPIDPDSDLTPVRIHNGDLIIAPDTEGLAPLTIETSGSENYYVHLKPLSYSHLKSTASELSFYVSGGSSTEILVPLGNYEIYYATGEIWYGLDHLFGSKTVRFKCDDTFNFYENGDYYQGWTVTLYKVSNGNMTTQEISEDEFPV